MKLTLRITLLTIMLTVVGFTITGLGVTSYWNARASADDLSRQILEQKLLRIDQQINALLLTATKQVALNRRLLESGLFSSNDFARLAPYWLEQMNVHHRLTRLSLALDANGEWYHVRRSYHDALVVGELHRNLQTGKLELRNYWPGQYPQTPFFTDMNRDDEDPRRQPWYIEARQSGKPIWSETYLLFSSEGEEVPGEPGVTHAAPLYRKDGSLLGVLTASFDLDELAHFVEQLQVGRNGFAFLVEFRKDGTRRVIAYPNRSALFREIRHDGTFCGYELVPTEQLADERVQAFLKQLPPDLDPPELNGSVRIRFTQKGIPYLGAYACLSTRETPDWLICTVLPESDVFARVEHHNRISLFIGLCVLAAAVLVSLFVSAQVAGPLEKLAHETAAIGRLQMDPGPEVRSVVQEVDRLAKAILEMKRGLRSFQKYVPAELVRSLLVAGEEARLGGELRTVTIYFCDIADFTAISENLAPEQLVEQLGQYLGALSSQILEMGGTVDKYLGDGIMAFWGAPVWNPEHARAACTAAVRNRERSEQLQRGWKEQEKPLFSTRMGLHTGQVVVGNIGSEARLNYTVIGDAVNLASRLEGLNKLYGTQILISESTYLAARSAVLARPLDWVSVKGKTGAVLVYELLGLRREASPGAEEIVNRYGLALNHYRKQDWVQAIGLFERVLELRPADSVSQQMIARCRRYRDEPPGDDWDGVHRVADK
jgi:adenylate cyclase